MEKSKDSVLKIILMTLIVFLVAAFLIYTYSDILLLQAVSIGYALSLLNIIFGYTSTRWGFNRSTKTFLAVVLGGMAIRFIVFAVTLLIIYRYSNIPLLGFLISFILFYLFLQYFEIRFINQELKGLQKQNR